MRVQLDGPHQTRAFALLVRDLLKNIVRVNQAQIRSGQVGRLYSGRIRYKTEPKDADSFVDASTVWRRGFGDCAHLAAFRVAELQERGERARLRVKWGRKRQGKPRPFHVQVRRGDGSIEDPSARLGMGRS